MAAVFSVKEEVGWTLACGKREEEVETVGSGIVPGSEGLPSSFRGLW
jgi:hypothetical protein